MIPAQPIVFAETGGVIGSAGAGDLARIKASGYATKNRVEQLWVQLETERSSWTPHWRDLADFILPRRVRFNVTDRNRGDKRNQKIINNTATLAARTLRSGMTAGLTSPARPWFKLSLFEADLLDNDEVKYWLDDVTRRMNAVMSRSNLYNCLPIGYGDIGVFGTAAMSVLEDDEKVFRCGNPPIGSYVLSNNERGIVDVFGRECEMTVRQIVMRFAKTREKSGSLVWDNISSTVKTAWERDQFEMAIPVKHFVMPNEMYDPYALEPKFKKFRSVYYEDGSQIDKFLSESGYDEFPILAFRWDVLGEDAYGTSPGMDALGDSKALQTLERRKAQADEKKVNPPMTGPSSLRNQKATLLAGDVTYVDVREGQQGFRPAHETNFSTKEAVLDIEKHQQRIQRAFYEDLFLMLTLSDRREMTAREVQERHEEKLVMLGPVMERLNDELLDPMIDRVFAIMDRRGMIPPPPSVLQGGSPLKVEYVSLMAQAQKMVNIAGMERFATFVTNLAAIDPAVTIKANTDYMIEDYADALSQPPRVLRTDEEVAAIREEQRRMAAAQQRAENAKNLSGAVKGLATAPMDQDNALKRLVDNAAAEEV